MNKYPENEDRTVADDVLERTKEHDDFWTALAMEKYGGSFVQSLAECLRRADAGNKVKLKNAFPLYFKEYGDMGDYLKENEEIS